jgi:ribosome-associated toxin RatA of RatAB toxin-antitoxin module
MIEERVNILETVMSAIAFDRLNLHFKKEREFLFYGDIYHYGANQIELVLNIFQLPCYFFHWSKYYEIIEKDTIEFDDIKAFIKLITYRSKVYLTKETRNNINQIKKALKNQWNFDELKEKLNLNLSKENAPYYWFLFHEKLCKDLMRTEHFLADITLAEEIKLVSNIEVYKNFFNTVAEHRMDSSKVEEHLIVIDRKMIFLYEFIVFKGLEKYEKIIKLNEIL